MLDHLVAELNAKMRLPRLRWRRAVISVKVKLPFAELNELAIRCRA